MSRSPVIKPLVSSETAVNTEFPAISSLHAIREPSLVRLVESIGEFNPELARLLCVTGLANLRDPAARKAWEARLAPFLDGGSDHRPSLPA